jgi:hypothetical protein
MEGDVLEASQEPNTPHPRSSPIDLEMLVVIEGGRERSIPQFHELMSRSRLQPGAVRHASTGVSLIEAVKAAH